MLAQYLLHNDKTLLYIDYTLYRLDKTRITFKNHCPIDAKLSQTNFNYPKFHAMTHFVKCIQDYSRAINYNMTHNEVVHKHFLKAFYRETKKKRYESQILQYNIYHTNILAIEDTNFLAKAKYRKKKQFAVDIDSMPDINIMRVCNAINIFLKYGLAVNCRNNNVAVDLGLQEVQKY